MASLPPDLLAPLPSETPEERHSRRVRIAHLIRRRRRLAGLTFKQVAHASYMDASRVSRYEQGWQYPGPSVLKRLLDAIERLERQGAGNPKRAEQARLEYEAEEAEDGSER